MSETISDLYFRLGLDSSDLQSDFIDADKTISANIRRLNREQNLIQLRAQVELNGLDDAANSTKGLAIQQESLARQIEIQQSRISLVNAAYQEMAAAQGENAEVTQQLLLQLERERLALSKLEQQTRSLNEQQKIALGMNFEMLGLIEPAMKGIDNAIAAGRNIPIPHAKAVAAAAIGILSIVAGTIEKTSELRENNPANVLAEGFDDAQGSIATDLSAINADVAAATEAIDRQTQASAANARQYAQEVSASYEDYIQDFLRLEQILTAENETLHDSLRTVDGQLPYMKTGLGKYAAMAFGVAKSFEALKNSAIEFARPAIEGFQELSKTASELNLSISKTSDLINTARLAGGEFEDVRDWVRGIQDAVIKGDIDDPEVLAIDKYVPFKTIQDSMGNLLSFEETLDRLIEGARRAEEAGELEAYALMTQGEGIKDILPALKSWRQAQKDFENAIRWSTTDEAALKEVSHNMKLATVQAEEFEAALSALGVPLANLALESEYEQFKLLTDVIEDNRETILMWEFAFIEAVKRVGRLGITDKIKELVSFVPDKIQGLISSLLPESEEGGLLSEAKKAVKEYIAANEKAARESEKAAKGFNAGLSYSIKRIREYRKELTEINRELKWGDSSYQKQIADIGAWRAEALKNAKYYAEERAIIDKLTYAKIQRVEADRAKALQDIRDSMEPVGKTDYQRRMAEADKDRQSWINLGMSEIEALELTERKKQQIREEYLQKAQELIRDAADREYSLTHSAFEKQLYDVERWRQAQLEMAETAEEVAATIADAAMKEAEAFKNAIDQMESAVHRMQDDMARKTMSPMEYDYYAAQQQYNDYRKTLPKSVADEWYRIEMARIAKKAAEEEERYRRAQAAEEERFRQAQARGNDAERRTIENPYTKSPGLGTSPLVNADARAVAAMGVLEKYGISAEELQRELSNATTAQEAYRNVLQRLTGKMNEASGKLGNAATGAVDSVSGLGDAASEGAEKITSAAETVRLAFEYLAEIEEENARRAREFQTPKDESKIPITYGDEDDDYSIPSDKRIPITYGDEEDIPFSTFEEPMRTAAEVVRDFSDNLSSTPITEFQQEVQQATGSVTDSAGATKNLADAAETAGTSTNAFSEKLNQTADMLDALREKIANMPIQPPPQQPQQYDNFSDLIDNALKATATVGEVTALGGLATAQPEIALLGAGIEALANTAQTLREIAKDIPAQPTPTPTQPQPQPNSPAATTADLSAIQQPLTEINAAAVQVSQTLTEISKTLNTIAQTPQIDLSPLQQTLSEIRAAIQAIEIPPTLAEIPQELQALSAATTPALEGINTSIQGAASELSQRLAEIAQSMSTLAQSAANNQNRQPPQVNVNVSPNINLGGAYVFDNAMKQRLTDDITTEVANAVTSAVQTATRQANYGYGN